jgi:hypothetical protein
MVWFNAKKFACRTCGLRLDSTLEMSTAGMSSGHAVEDADPRDFQPAFDAALRAGRHPAIAQWTSSPGSP